MKSKNKINGFSFVEIMIAVVLAALVLIPLVTIMNKTVNQTHQMNHEITAELIGKNILDQIVKGVAFDKVTPNITVGKDAGCDVKLAISDEGKFLKTSFEGYKSGSIIKVAGADFKWEIEIIDIAAKDVPLSFWIPEKKYGKGEWPTFQKGTKKGGLDTIEFHGDTTKADSFTQFEDLIILKTIKLRISWRLSGEKNNFTDPRKNFILVTRKALLDDNIRIKKMLKKAGKNAKKQ